MNRFLDRLEQYRVILGCIMAVLLVAVGGVLVWIDWHPPVTHSVSTQTVVKRGVPAVSATEASVASAPTTTSVSKPATHTSALVNINTATESELDSLPGVGKTYATRIIQYRLKHGSFQNIHDIVKVNGIGEAIFAKIEHRITVGGN
jgi:comEA protein